MYVLVVEETTVLEGQESDCSSPTCCPKPEVYEIVTVEGIEVVNRGKELKRKTEVI
jgi:hypothetical protein